MRLPCLVAALELVALRSIFVGAAAATLVDPRLPHARHHLAFSAGASAPALCPSHRHAAISASGNQPLYSQP